MVKYACKPQGEPRGGLTCPFRWTFKSKDLSSLDHLGVALALTWVASLSVKLGLTLGLIELTNHINVGKVRVEENNPKR
jgi:hypothetical protein